MAGPPLEYGQLTWGLPFGMSIDITAALLTRYVRGYVDAPEMFGRMLQVARSDVSRLRD